MNTLTRITTVILFFTLAGCSDKPAPSKTAAEPEPQAQAPVSSKLPANHPGIQKAPERNLSNEGKVLSVEQTQSYTYLEVQALANGLGYWLAATHLDVNVGDNVRWGKFTIMKNFQSKALGRTFDQVLFVNAIEKVVAGQPSQIPSSLQSGKVITATSSAGYVYIEVETTAGKRWLAAPDTPVQKGSDIEWSSGNVMRNFSSSSLNKTFDEIIFVSAVSVLK